MKRVWPIIAVANVPASAKWYMNLLGAQQTHPGGTTFDQIVDEDGTVILCLHHWGPTGASGTHQWPTLLKRGTSDENGLLLWFVVDDFARAWERAKGLRAAMKRSRIRTTELASRRSSSAISTATMLPLTNRGQLEPRSRYCSGR